METLVFWFLAGCSLGIFTGLSPGIHVNTVSLIAVSLSADRSNGIAVMIAAMSIVHSFMDFVPSILLGAPDSESFMAMLPGHRMFARGKGELAIKLTAIGGLTAGILSLAIAPFFFLFFSKTSEIIARAVPFVLMGVLLLMVIYEKKRLVAISVICLSALLGLIALDSGMQVNEPLFPLITGFFGVSSLVQSIISENRPAKQEAGRHSFSSGKIIFGSIISVLSGMIVAVLPSIGSGQAAFILKKIAGKIRTRTYLVVLGGISTSNAIFAFFALFAFGKTRSGTAAAVSRVIETGSQELFLITAAIFAAIGIGALSAMIISEIAAGKIEKINYKKMNTAVLILLFFLTLAISGVQGMLVMLTAAGIGLVAVFSGIKRTTCMSFLIVPTLIFYLNIYYIL